MSRHHIFLSTFIPAMGSISKVNLVFRLFCTVLWSITTCIIFSVGLPAYKLQDVKLDMHVIYSLPISPILLGLNIVFILMAKLVTPKTSWSMHLPQNRVPESRVTTWNIVNRKTTVSITQSRHRLTRTLQSNVLRNPVGGIEDMRHPSSGVDDMACVETVKSSSVFQLVRGQSSVMLSPSGGFDDMRHPSSCVDDMALANAVTTSVMQFVYDRMSRSPEFMLEDQIKRRIIMNLERKRKGIQKSIALEKTCKPKPGETEDDKTRIIEACQKKQSKLFQLTTDWFKDGSSCDNDYLFSDDNFVIKSKNVFASKSSRVTYRSTIGPSNVSYAHLLRKKSVIQSRNPNGNTWYSILLKNVIHCLLFVNIASCIGFVSMASIYRNINENVFIFWYACVLFLLEIFLLEPVFFLLMAIGSAVVRSCMPPPGVSSAQQRADDAQDVINQRCKTHDANYVNRMEYIPNWEYKLKGDRTHNRITMRLREMNMRFRNQAKMESKYSGTFGFLVFIICAIIVVRVHTNIRMSFRQKRLVYAALGLNDDLKKTVEVPEIWGYLKRYHLPFIHHKTLEGAPQYDEARVFGKIRQIRVKANTKCTTRGIKELDQLMGNKECYQWLNYKNLETTDYINSWRHAFNETGSTTTQNISLNFGIRSYHKENTVGKYFKPQYPWDSYQFIFRELYQDNTDAIFLMESSDWIDNYTRAVILDTSIVNINTGIASTLVITYHFMPNGIRLTHNIDSFVFDLERSAMYVLLGGLCGFAVLALMDILDYISKIGTFGVRYFSKREHFIDLINTLFVVCLLIGFAFRYYITVLKQKAFEHHILGTDGPLFISLVDLSLLVNTLNYTSGILAFGALMRIFQAAGNFNRLRILMIMIRSVFIMTIIPGNSIMALSWCLYLKFGQQSAEYSTFIQSYLTTTQFIVSKGNLGIENSQLRKTTQVFMWAVFFLLITNGFVVALNHLYSVHMDISKRKNKGKKETSILYEMKVMLFASLGLTQIKNDDKDKGNPLNGANKQKKGKQSKKAEESKNGFSEISENDQDEKFELFLLKMCKG